MAIETIGVIGAGTMGRGIAEAVAAKGFQVLLSDQEMAFLEKGIDLIGRSLERAVVKGKMTAAERDETSPG